MSQIHIESLGSGPDLVFLHGWAMHSGVWMGIKDQLSCCFRLHLVDLPGHGLSPACGEASLSQLTDMIADILPENCIVCGWSLGGLIAMRLALHRSSKVKQLVLIATTPCFVKHEEWAWGMDARTLRLFSENLLQNYVVTIHRFLSLQVSGEDHASTILKQLRQSFIQQDRPDIEMLQASLKILLTSDLREELKQITQSVLLIHGDRDVITHSSAANWMHQQLAQSKLVMFPHCGHAPFLSNPDQFISSLHEFRASFR